MNIVAAHVKKDLVPLRGLVIAMGVLLGLTFLDWVLNTSRAARVSGGNFGSLQFLLLLILAVRAIHLDTLVEPEAFWKTRPITRGQLLLAKASLIFGALAVFAIVSIPWSGRSGSLFAHAVTLSGFAAFACVTSSFSAMFWLFIRLMLISIAISLFLSFLGAAATGMNSNFLHWPVPSLKQFSSEGFGMFLSAVVALAYLTVVVFQYLTLKTRISVRAISVVTVVGLVMSSTGKVG